MSFYEFKYILSKIALLFEVQVSGFDNLILSFSVAGNRIGRDGWGIELPYSLMQHSQLYYYGIVYKREID